MTSKKEIEQAYNELNYALDTTEPCYNDDPELWTANYVNSIDKSVAEALCAGCHVIEQCAKYAILAQEPEFIWGGTRPVDRIVNGTGRRPAKKSNRRPTNNSK
jgi:hypothetical protein